MNHYTLRIQALPAFGIVGVAHNQSIKWVWLAKAVQSINNIKLVF